MNIEGLKEKIMNNKKNRIIFFSSVSIVIIAIIILSAFFLLKEKEISQCYVQFESNGGSEIQEQIINCGEKIEKPNNPTKTGFRFIDWYYNDEIFNFEQEIKEDMIIKAKWQAEENTEIIKVKFDSNGGTEIEAIEVAKGETITPPVVPSKEGYEFIEWRLKESKFDFNTKITEEITLKAEWEKLPEDTKPTKKPSGNTKPNGTNTKPSGENNQGNSGTSEPSKPTTPENPSKPEEPNTPEEPEEPETPSEELRYTYFHPPLKDWECPYEEFSVIDGKCYQKITLKEHYGCNGRVINGKCYYSNGANVSYYCDGHDEYIEDTEGGVVTRRRCIPMILDVSSQTYVKCPWEGYELNSEGKCQKWIYANKPQYEAHIKYNCNHLPGYTLYGDSCIKEIGYGNIPEECPNGYNRYCSNNKQEGYRNNCYCEQKESNIEAKRKYFCEEPLELRDGGCYRKNW